MKPDLPPDLSRRSVWANPVVWIVVLAFAGYGTLAFTSIKHSRDRVNSIGVWKTAYLIESDLDIFVLEGNRKASDPVPTWEEVKKILQKQGTLQGRVAEFFDRGCLDAYGNPYKIVKDSYPNGTVEYHVHLSSQSIERLKALGWNNMWEHNEPGNFRLFAMQEDGDDTVIQIAETKIILVGDSEEVKPYYHKNIDPLNLPVQGPGGWGTSTSSDGERFTFRANFDGTQSVITFSGHEIVVRDRGRLVTLTTPTFQKPELPLGSTNTTLRVDRKGVVLP